MSKQLVPTSKAPETSKWDYIGEYREYPFVVFKGKDGGWYVHSETNIDGQAIIASAPLKRDAVNSYVKKLDEHLQNDEPNEVSEYQEKIYSGIPIFDIQLVSEGTFQFEDRTVVDNSNDASNFLIPYFEKKDREEVVVVLMDAGSSIIGMHVLSKGGLTSSIVDIKNILKVAILSNAAAIILAHNHPSGNPVPSQNDIDITRRAQKACDLMDILLLDHLIIAGKRGYSFINRV